MHFSIFDFFIFVEEETFSGAVKKLRRFKAFLSYNSLTISIFLNEKSYQKKLLFSRMSLIMILYKH